MGATFHCCPPLQDIRERICRCGSAAYIQPALSTVTALLTIHESKLVDSHLTCVHGVSPLGRSDQWKCLLTLNSPALTGNHLPSSRCLTSFLCLHICSLIRCVWLHPCFWTFHLNVFRLVFAQHHHIYCTLQRTNVEEFVRYKYSTLFVSLEARYDLQADLQADLSSGLRAQGTELL